MGFDFFSQYKFKFLAYGVAVGLFFPALATTIRYLQNPFNFYQLLALHQTDLLLLIIDTAPIVLGLAGFLLGKKQETILNLSDFKTINKINQFSYNLDRAIATASNAEQVIDSALKYFCEFFNCAYAGYWNFDPQQKEFHLTQHYTPGLATQSIFLAQSQTMRFKIGEGLPGRTITDQHPHWIHIANDPNLPRKPLALKENLISGLGFPLMAEQTVIGVIELFSKTPVLHSELLEKEISGIASRLGQVLQRYHVQNQMLTSAKMASLGEMAAGIAHEINNPLAIINGKLVVLQLHINSSPTPDATKIKTELSQIEKNCQRIVKIIRGLKAFSRNQNSDPMQKNKLSSIINETLEFCQDRLRKNSIELNLEPCPELELECHASEISQIILNLLNNACDAIANLDQKWIKISYALSTQQLKILITDSGSGIAPNVVSKLMTPFFTTKEVGKGTGLGLSISKKIAENHQGTLHYSLADGHTQFALTLPLVQANAGTGSEPGKNSLAA